MKTKFIPTLLAALLFSFVIIAMSPKKEMLKIGASLPATDLKMKNVDNKEYNLKEIAGEKGVLVIFSCNTCPFVVGNGSKSEGWQNRYPKLGDLAKEMGVSLVLVNSNEAKRKAGDSLEDMQKQYKEQNYNGYYLYDENSVLANEFGALTTPHVYLFNSSMKLVYRGAIDDNVDRQDEVKEQYLIDALNNLNKGEKIDPETTRQLGCSIKRV